MAEKPGSEEAIFQAAIRLDDTGQRAALLEAACRNDPDLRQRIESLIGAYEAGDSVLRRPGADDVTETREDVSIRPGEAIGRYKLLQEIGEGGFGVVYMAEQTEPVRRRVALKIIKLGMDTKQVVGRFESERQALAMMDHPNIAKVIDAGATDTGRPYFVMELVRGLPILEFCDQNRLSPRERLKLFIQVCHAVQHAHQKGIIHRDIKPSNVLVTMHDDRPMPKVIDFGIAKATEQRLTEKTVFTEFKQFIGTPAYMSPEQAAFSGLDVDTRSDIYSLGVLLYELLTGTTPFDQKRLRGIAYDELCRVIREDVPPTPSSRVTTLGERTAAICRTRATEPALLKRLLRGDVDWIVMKAIEKDRTRRYETANALAADIGRYLDGEPVSAAAPSAWYRARKYVARNKLAVVSTTAVALALIVGTLFASINFVRARRAQADLENQLQVTKDERKRADDARQIADGAREIADDARAEADLNLYVSDMNRAWKAYGEADVALALSLLEEHRATYGNTFEWRCLYSLCRAGDAVHTFREHSGAVNSLAFSKDGILASGSWDGSLKLFDVSNLQVINSRQHTSGIRLVEFSADAETLVTLDAEGKLTRWNVRPFEAIAPWAHEGSLVHFALSLNGRVLAASTGNIYVGDGEAHAWNWETREKLIPIGNANLLRFSIPDGKFLAGAAGLTVSIWKTADLSKIRPWGVIGTAHTSGVTDVQFSPGKSRYFATSSWDTLIAIWDVDEIHDAELSRGVMAPLSTFRGHRALVSSLAYSPDSRFLASGSHDYTVKLWPGRPPWEPEQSELVTLRGHTAPVLAVDYSPDGNFIASGSADGAIKLWPGDGRTEANILSGHEDWVFSVAFSPDDRTLATGGFDGRVILWDMDTRRWKSNRKLHKNQVFSVVFSPDGEWLASCDAVWKVDRKRGLTFKTPGNVYLTHLEDSNRSGPINLPEAAGVRAIDFSHDGRFLVIGDHAGRLWKWDVEAGRLRDRSQVGEGIIDSVRVSPDGKTVAVLEWLPGGRRERGQPKRLSLWSVDSLERVTVLASEILSETFKMAFSEDGGFLACGEENDVRVFDLANPELSRPFIGHTSPVMSIAYAPDGNTLATTSVDHTVKLWNIKTSQEVATLSGHRGPVSGLAFSQFGDMLVSTSEDKSIRLWPAEPAND